MNCTNCESNNSNNAKYCSACGFELPKHQSEPIDNTVPQKASQTSEKKKKVAPILVGVLAFTLCYFAVQHFLFKKPSFDKAMIEIASELNKSCPIMVDQNTRLDNTMVMPNNVFMYNYTLLNFEKQNINIDELKSFIEPNVINNMKTNPDMKVYRENRTTMAYNYKDKNGEFVLRINVTPEKYE